MLLYIMPSGRAGSEVLVYSDDVNLLEGNSMNFNAAIILLKANKLSRYSDWLRAGRPGEAGVQVPVR
jgi:hypothetical protein